MKNMLPNIVEAIFLDFDGVVVESNDIKTQAFYEAYRSYGETIAERAKQYHLNHQGVNRRQKFETIHQQYLNKTCSPAEAQSLSEKFLESVFHKIIETDFVPGVIDFLEKMQRQKIPVFLLSATPHQELCDIAEKKDISRFFKEIIGYPTTKPEAGLKIIQQYHFHPDQIIFIGDSQSDLRAAKALKVHFIGRRVQSNTEFEDEIQTIADFTELL